MTGGWSGREGMVIIGTWARRQAFIDACFHFAQKNGTNGTQRTVICGSLRIVWSS